MKLRLFLLVSTLLASMAVFAADVTGTWQITISDTMPDGTVRRDTGIARLQQTGDVVTGSVGQDESRQTPISEGSIKNDKVIIKTSQRPERTLTFELSVSGEKLVGTVSRTGDNQTATVEFVRSVKQ